MENNILGLILRLVALTCYCFCLKKQGQSTFKTLSSRHRSWEGSLVI